jgi:hypothetical protein
MAVLDWIKRNKVAIGVLVPVIGGSIAFVAPYVAGLFDKGSIAKTTINESVLQAQTLLQYNCLIAGEIAHHRKALNPRLTVPELAEMRDKVTKLADEIDVFVLDRRSALKSTASAIADEARLRTEQLKQNKNLVVGSIGTALSAFAAPPLGQKPFAEKLRVASFYAISAMKPTAQLANDGRSPPCDRGPYSDLVMAATAEFETVLTTRNSAAVNSTIAPWNPTDVAPASAVPADATFNQQLKNTGDLRVLSIEVQEKFKELQAMGPKAVNG